MRNIFLASAAAATVFAGLGANGAASAQSGSFQQSCRNTSSANGMLSAECADRAGRFHQTSIPFGQCRGDISNNNGMLTCNGATGSGGAIVGGGPPNNGGGRGNEGYNGNNYNAGNARRDNNDRRDNNGGFTAGIVAGALLGGALAAPPPPPPPAYGDPRYGDPRFDWRYQQGGYGYGRRPGEWVPIADRADWLNRQIDDLLREGRIDYRDARDYRRQLDSIQSQERDMMRYGRLGPRQRDDLDHRFGDLTAEIRHDARED
jgi:hypothetical protein